MAISSRNTTTCVVTTRRRTSPHTTHDCGRSPRRPTLERFSPTSRAAVVHSEHATAFAHPKVLANKQVHAHKSAYIHAYIRHIQHNTPSHIHMHTNQHNTHTHCISNSIKCHSTESPKTGGSKRSPIRLLALPCFDQLLSSASCFIAQSLCISLFHFIFPLRQGYKWGEIKKILNF